MSQRAAAANSHIGLKKRSWPIYERLMLYECADLISYRMRACKIPSPKGSWINLMMLLEQLGSNGLGASTCIGSPMSIGGFGMAM